ncbi:uncharacterized protein LOC122856748 [Aphidius gifuensis]|uniref:uncharacterized protein LOC122856748 n=1 Tax=Aphidius gifuensis TaxID=684658 RepID=UPI001CDC7710|nr:uncharacterized protein LOC122856748 [Aphidius gifuensis]
MAVFDNNSPYLDAIQKIPGKTPGEKLKTLNNIANKFIAVSANTTDKIQSTPELSDVLVPIVSLEVAKVLHQPEEIVAALKSDDIALNDRALKVKWFFNGTNKNITNFDYFYNNIFSYVSVNTRDKIIKKLAKHLLLKNHTTIAEEFYINLKNKYGDNSARRLCFACSENFIENTIFNWKKTLNFVDLDIIYQRYPNVAIKYIKKNTEQYQKFLPKLLKKHPNEFVNLAKEYSGNLYIELTHKKSELFLKNCRHELLENPKIFFSILPLEFITSKLTKTEFYKVFKGLFPSNIDSFDYDEFYIYINYLKYYDEKEKFNYFMSTFQDLYGLNFLEKCPMTFEIIKLLDPEERIKQARIKLENDESIGKSKIDIEELWICYLPTNESIPVLKEKITKTSDADDRCEFLKALIYTCSINKDDDALLNVLDYIFSHHKNEKFPAIHNILDQISTDFDIKNLPNEHLVILDKFIRFLNIKNLLKKQASVSKTILGDLIYSKIKNQEDIYDYIGMYIGLQYPGYYHWEILIDYPEYNRKCLVEIIERTLILKDKFQNYLSSLISSLLEAMADFNESNSKAKKQLDNLDIQNFPLLLEAVKDILKSNYKAREDTDDPIKKIKKYLKKINENIYLELELSESEFNDSSIIKQLQKSPDKIIQNWEACFDKCKQNIKKHNFVRRFLNYARWHQDLPILFSIKCFNELKNEDADMKMLAVLYEGASYEKLITPLIPDTMKLDLEDERTKDQYELNTAIIWSLCIVNPPLSLNPVVKYFEEDYKNVIVHSLNNIARRIPVDKIMEFSKTLSNQIVSIKKHGIKLFCLVGSFEQKQMMLIDLWKNENHISIRQIIFECCSKLFIDTPNLQNWNLIKNCIAEIKIEDYFWNNILDYKNISDEYFTTSIMEVLKTIKRIEETNSDFKLSTSPKYIGKILRNNMSRLTLFTEELHENIINNYFADVSRCEFILSEDIQMFVINGYIGEANDEQFEFRIKFLTKLLSEIVNNHWDISSDLNPNFSPANFMIGRLIHGVGKMSHSPRKIETAQTLLDDLSKILRPKQLGICYLNLTYIILIDDITLPETTSNKLVQLIPSLIEIYSNEAMPMIVSTFKKYLWSCFDRYIFNSNYIYGGKHIFCLEVIGHLASSNDELIILFATLLLLEIELHCIDVSKYLKIIQILKKSKHPAVTLALSDSNYFSYEIFIQNQQKIIT